MVETNHREDVVETHSEVLSPIPLNLEIEEPTIVRYLSQFDEQDWPEKATEAMKVGVIVIENASPTLDTRVVWWSSEFCAGQL
jgi:hypothetical protein